jgi:hypothetical protein
VVLVDVDVVVVEVLVEVLVDVLVDVGSSVVVVVEVRTVTTILPLPVWTPLSTKPFVGKLLT